MRRQRSSWQTLSLVFVLLGRSHFLTRIMTLINISGGGGDEGFSNRIVRACCWFCARELQVIGLSATFPLRK